MKSIKVRFNLNEQTFMSGATPLFHHKQGWFQYPRDMNKLVLVPVPPEKNLLEAILEVGPRACNLTLAYRFQDHNIHLPTCWKDDGKRWRTIYCAGSLFTPNNGEVDFPKTSRLVPQLDFISTSPDDNRVTVEPEIFGVSDVAGEHVYLLCFKERSVFRTKPKRRKKRKVKKSKPTA